MNKKHGTKVTQVVSNAPTKSRYGPGPRRLLRRYLGEAIPLCGPGPAPVSQTDSDMAIARMPLVSRTHWAWRSPSLA
jgi:hypothetical protein